MTERPAGRVLLLVGPSSVGKTAIAKALQRSLGGVWFVAGVDLFWGVIDEDLLPEGEFRTDSPVMERITRGWHRAVAAIAADGNNVIVDELATHSWWLDDWHEVLRGSRWWSVLLTASPDVLSEREAGRGDRPIGLAAADAASEVAHARFDLVVDTDGMSVAACAEEISRSTVRRS